MRKPSKVLSLALLVVVVGCARPDGEAASELRFDGEWPQWRGPTRDGHASLRVAAAEQSWPVDEPEAAWRRSLGPGFSSLAISGGRLLTLEADGGSEWLIALDAGSGRRLWRERVGERYESYHGDGPRSTPAVDGELAVAMGALGGLVAVDVEGGSPRWRRDLLELSGGDREDWGFASSPLIDGGRVYLHGAEGVTALALDLASGEILWRLDEGPGGYASPLLAEVDGRRQLVSFLGAGLFGLDPDSGSVLWRFDWSTYYDLNAADPIVLSPREIFISSNYATGAGLIEISPEGASARWKNPRVRNHWASSVAIGGLIYGFDRSFLVAVDPADGSVLWKVRGFGEGSPLAVGEHLLIVGDDGTVALGAVSRDGWTELRRYESLVEGPVRAAPVLVGGRLFLRGKGELTAFDVATFDSGA